VSLLFIILFLAFAWSCGFLAFHGAPVVESLRSRSRTMSNLHLWLAMWCVNRAALVLRADGELDWKKLNYDDVGAERVGFGSVTKFFADPDDALSTWGGRPFALADEIHGTLFTPVHASVGQAIADRRDRDELFARATDAEAKAYGVVGWIRSVLEIPRRVQVVDLSAVRALATGSERGEHPEHVETFYINSQNPDGQQMSIVRLLLPFLWFVALIVLFWQIGTRTGGGGGDGGGSTITYSAWLLASIAPAAMIRRRIGSIVVALLAVGAFVVILALLGPLVAIASVIAFALGFTFVPFVGLVLGFLRIGGHLSRLFVRLGLLGYREPIFYYDDDGYELIESDQLPDGAMVHGWHVLANTRVGFAYDPALLEGTAEHVPVAQLQRWAEEHDPTSVARGIAEQNGYDDPSEEVVQQVGRQTAVPQDSYRAPWVKSGTADYAGYLPVSPSDDSVYLQSNIAGQRLDAAFEGDLTDDKHQAAKEEYGDGVLNSIGDRMLVASMLVSTVVATVFGWVMFL
jgi:hypothetical protein